MGLLRSALANLLAQIQVPHVRLIRAGVEVKVQPALPQPVPPPTRPHLPPGLPSPAPKCILSTSRMPSLHPLQVPALASLGQHKPSDAGFGLWDPAHFLALAQPTPESLRTYFTASSPYSLAGTSVLFWPRSFSGFSVPNDSLFQKDSQSKNLQYISNSP